MEPLIKKSKELQNLFSEINSEIRDLREIFHEQSHDKEAHNIQIKTDQLNEIKNKLRLISECCKYSSNDSTSYNSIKSES